MTRFLMFALLGIVAAAAAVPSCSALRDLALRCGFAPELAWLLPVVLDAGAAAGSAAQLSGRATEAGRFGRLLALGLLITSVVGNALGHGLEAFAVAAPWGLVALAPAVLALRCCTWPTRAAGSYRAP